MREIQSCKGFCLLPWSLPPCSLATEHTQSGGGYRRSNLSCQPHCGWEMSPVLGVRAQALTNSERRPEAPDKEEGTAAGPLRNSSVQVPQDAARPGLCLAFTLINKSFSEKQ